MHIVLTTAYSLSYNLRSLLSLINSEEIVCLVNRSPERIFDIRYRACILLTSHLHLQLSKLTAPLLSSKRDLLGCQDPSLVLRSDFNILFPVVNSDK